MFYCKKKKSVWAYGGISIPDAPESAASPQRNRHPGQEWNDLSLSFCIHIGKQTLEN